VLTSVQPQLADKEIDIVNVRCAVVYSRRQPYSAALSQPILFLVALATKLTARWD